MGNRDRSAARRAYRVAAALPLLLAVAGCAGDDDSQTSAPPEPLDAASTATPESTTTPLCAEARHLVVFDVFGTLTLDDEEYNAWVGNPGDEPSPRAGGTDVTNAYRERGYELLYVTTATPDVTIGGMSIVEAMSGWLESNGFPTGEGTRIWTWDARGNGFVSMVDELVRLGGSGVSTDAGYTDNEEVVRALSSGGVLPDALYTFGDAAGTAGTMTLPGDDLEAHVPAVRRLGMVCQP